MFIDEIQNTTIVEYFFCYTGLLIEIMEFFWGDNILFNWGSQSSPS